MKNSILGLAFLVTISGCTLEATTPPEAEDMAILNDKNYANIGKSVVVANSLADGASTYVERVFPAVLNVSSDVLGSPRNLTLSLNSTPISVDLLVDTPDNVLLQARIVFSAGSSAFGLAQDGVPIQAIPPIVTTETDYDPEIWVDVGRGTLVTIPNANKVTVDLIIRSQKAIPFNAGSDTSPTYRVNLGLSYDPPNSAQATYTTLRSALDADPAHGKSGALFVRPQFATSFRVNMQATNAVGGKVVIQWVSLYGITMSTAEYALPITGVLPELPWYEGADSIRIDYQGLSQLVPPLFGLADISVTHILAL